MIPRTLYREQWLPLTLETAWEFLSNPWNLPKITPPQLGFEIRSDPPKKIYSGLLIEYRVHPFPGVPCRWLSEIRHVVEGRSFVDEQRAGPYRFWHHAHYLEPADGGVLMVDRICYGLPFGWVGDLAAHWLVKKQLEEIFRYREGRLNQLFPEGSA